MSFFFPRLMAPVIALAVGTWIGLGKPPAAAMVSAARPEVLRAEASARRLVSLAEERLAATGTSTGPKAKTPAAPREVEAPFQTVDPTQLPDPAAFPRVNPDRTMRRAWLVAEGPKRTVEEPHRYVTITLDDGPFPETTPAALRLLARYGVRATFFFIGRYLDGDGPRAVASREVARQVAEAGHFIGNHTHDHHILTLESKAQAIAQIDRGAESIERAIGQRPNLFRPPYGQLDAFSESVLKERGNELVLWNIEVGDMKRTDVEGMAASLRSQLDESGGGVVLLHDIRGTSVQVLARLLEWLDAHKYDPSHPTVKGYDVVDLVTYMKATAANPQPYADRAELERARSEEWRRVRPKHQPTPKVRSEGHDVVL